MSPALDACPGVLTLHPARDGFVARIRLPGGYASAARWLALAALSREFGDGCVDVTARGNVQLRGLRAADAEALAARAAAVGLMPSAQHDRARNIMASPLAGLGGRLPLRDLVEALDAALLAGPEFAALPGRFLFALDDGTATASLSTCDIGLSYSPPDPASAGLASAGPAGLPSDRPAGGKPASGGAAAGSFDLIVAGRHVGVGVPAARAVAVVLAAARAALTSGVGDSVTRIGALPDGGQSVAAAAGGALGAPARPDTRLPLGPVPHLRGAEEAEEAGGAVVVAARLGRLTGEQIEVIAGLVAPGEVVRVGVAGRLVIPLGAPAGGGAAGGVADGISADSAHGQGAQSPTGEDCSPPAVSNLPQSAGEVADRLPAGAEGGVSAGEVADRLAAGAEGGLSAGAALARLAGAGLLVVADDAMADVTACSGAGCHRSLADVRAVAGPVSGYQKTHWAGCSRQCGCPPDAEPVVALSATRYRMPGEGGA